MIRTILAKLRRRPFVQPEPEPEEPSYVDAISAMLELGETKVYRDFTGTESKETKGDPLK